MGTTRLAIVVVVTVGLTLAAALILDFPADRLGAAVDFGSGFLGLPISHLAVTIG